MTSDRITLETIRHGLTYISEEMGVALRRSAYSPNIRERADHSCAIMDESGRTVGQAEHIPVHIGSLPIGVANTLSYLRREGVELEAGDMYVVNDPYIAGTHLNDIMLIRPVFHRGRLFAILANKAHHVDVGGISPASISFTASELYQEGLVIMPVKLMDRDILKMGVARMIAANSRTPETVMGDLRAQIAANLLGEKRLRELLTRHDLATFRESIEYILETTQRMAVAEYGKMVQGSWRAVDYLEMDEDFLRIEASVSIGREGFSVDFTGTSSQVDRPLNAVLGVTNASVMFTVKTILSPEIPLNHGFMKTVQIEAPPGTLLNPLRPAPVAAGNLETSQRIVDVLYLALSKGMPDRVPAASHGSMNNLMMGGVHPITGGRWAFYETIGGGGGGRYGLDGVNGVHTNMTNTMNTPIEVIERYYPIRFESYRLRYGSGGRGRWSGGMGIERSFTAKARIEVTIVGDRAKIPPWGLKGGEPGKPSQYLVRRKGGRIERLLSKDSTVLNPGDTLIIRTAGGGGYGSPDEKHNKVNLMNHTIGISDGPW
ncbi:MAG: hydantoinase B/oxoprolinase family protein [Nitrososphaerota archaeon]